MNSKTCLEIKLEKLEAELAKDAPRLLAGNYFRREEICYIIEEIRKGVWNLPSEKLPENKGYDFDRVLVTTINRNVTIGYYDDIDDEWRLPFSDNPDWPEEVIAWMPLPKPYQESP